MFYSFSLVYLLTVMPSRALRNRLTNALLVFFNRTIIKCSSYVKYNVDYYYDLKRLNSYAKYMCKQRTYDSTFSLFKFKRIENLKRGI